MKHHGGQASAAPAPRRALLALLAAPALAGHAAAQTRGAAGNPASPAAGPSTASPPGPAPGPPTGAELRIGALYPASGPLALLGDESFRGLELAVEARNEAGGVFGRPLRLVKAEASDAAQAGEAARRLIGTERVAAVFGSGVSPLSFAASQVTELAGIPYFELGAVADSITARGFRYLFRSCPRGQDLAALSLRAARWLLPLLWRAPLAGMRLAILHEDALFGQSVATAQEAGLPPEATLLGRFAYGPGGQDLPGLVQRLRAADAQLLLHTGHEADVLLLFRAMKEAGWRPRMVIGGGAAYSMVDTARSIGSGFEGVMVVDFPPYAAAGRMGADARRLAEAYSAKYGHEPRSCHSLANHAGARIFLDALHRAGSADKERIRAAVLATDVEERDAPFGWGAAFDEAGQNLRALPVLAQWQAGRALAVFPDGCAAALPRGEMG